MGDETDLITVHINDGFIEEMIKQLGRRERAILIILNTTLSSEKDIYKTPRVIHDT